eukprot:scaffold1328_cov394-Prasinococcus_capsulatus_cf.AAC.35
MRRHLQNSFTDEIALRFRHAEGKVHSDPTRLGGVQVTLDNSPHQPMRPRVRHLHKLETATTESLNSDSAMLGRIFSVGTRGRTRKAQCTSTQNGRRYRRGRSKLHTQNGDATLEIRDLHPASSYCSP